MNKNPDTCVACLSNDRTLIYLNEMRNILQYINFTELKIGTGGVCWECKNTIMKFYRFKRKALQIQLDMLLQFKVENLKPLTNLGFKVNVPFNYHYHYNDQLPTQNDQLSIDNDQLTIGNDQLTIDNNQLTIDNNQLTINKNLLTIDNGKLIIGNLKLPIDNNNLTIDNNQLLAGNDQLPIDNDPLTCDNLKQEINIKEEIEYSDIELTELDNIKMEEETEITDCDSIDVKPTNIDTVENPITISNVNDLNLESNNRNTLPTVSSSQIMVKEEIKDYLVEEEIPERYSNKCMKVIRTEKEMIKYREDKRNHHSFYTKPFQCDLCVFGYNTKEIYNAHMQSTHDKTIGPYCCDICKVYFPKSISLEAHRRRHYVFYKCNFCKYTTLKQSDMLVHCDMHDQDGNRLEKCNQCDALFRNKDELEEHLVEKHRLHCLVCKRVFKDPNTLKSHLHRMHAEDREFMCDVCKQRFLTKGRLESHMVKHNTQIAKKMSYCAKCKMQFKTIYTYRNHVLNSVHHAEKNYSCPDCGKSYTSKAYCRDHYEFTHLRISSFYCEPCDKLFRSKYRLKEHREVHHGLTRPRNHACSECGKKFFTPHLLREHIRIHSESRPYMCSLCGDTFKQRASLYTHTRLVHGGKKCPKKKRNTTATATNK